MAMNRIDFKKAGIHLLRILALEWLMLGVLCFEHSGAGRGMPDWLVKVIAFPVTLIVSVIYSLFFSG